MKLSIIIPVLNEAERIGALVRYLSAHGAGAVGEIIVVDGGSLDATADAAGAAGARVVRCPVQSRAAQMNTGARQASGGLLYFVHADTLPPPSFAADILGAVAAGRVMGCYRYRFDSPRWLLRINGFFTRFPWMWCQGGDKTFFIRREAFEELGGYDERFVIMEEYDFLRRARPRYGLHTIPKNALVSARKYRHNGWLRVQIANALVFNLFRWGVQPVRLKRIYKTILRRTS